MRVHLQPRRLRQFFGCASPWSCSIRLVGVARDVIAATLSYNVYKHLPYQSVLPVLQGPERQTAGQEADGLYNTSVTSHETRFRVRYAETDQMGVVYYANYLVWMEIGRVEYCRASGIRYKDMEADDGVRLAVVDAHCRYLRPARYDEEVVVRTRIARANRRMIEFHYEIRDERGSKLASGETKHIFLGADFKPVKLPEKYFAPFGIASKW